METCPIVKRMDIAEHDSYHAKELILGAYDRMAKAIESDELCQTILTRPPLSLTCTPTRVKPGS